jgi:hypothetical protein
MNWIQTPLSKFGSKCIMSEQLSWLTIKKERFTSFRGILTQD